MSAETLPTRLDDTVMYMSIKNPPVTLINGDMFEQLFDLTNLFRTIKALHKIDLFDDIDVMQSLGLGLQSLLLVTITKVNRVCRGVSNDIFLGMMMILASGIIHFCQWINWPTTSTSRR